MNQIARCREKSTPQGWITLILLLQSDGKCSITTRLKITRDSCAVHYFQGNVTVSLSPDTLLIKVIRPAVERAGIKNKRIGWHNFRHSLATNLRVPAWI